MVKVDPTPETAPMPDANTTPPQQKRYSPVERLNSTALPALESSCKQPNTVTLKLQVAVLPDVSVAVQVMVVDPTGKADPDGGLQSTLMTEQLSDACGAG
jgi:hypothetical protein